VTAAMPRRFAGIAASAVVACGHRSSPPPPQPEPEPEPEPEIVIDNAAPWDPHRYCEQLLSDTEAARFGATALQKGCYQSRITIDLMVAGTVSAGIDIVFDPATYGIELGQARWAPRRCTSAVVDPAGLGDASFRRTISCPGVPDDVSLTIQRGDHVMDVRSSRGAVDVRALADLVLPRL